MCACVYVRMYVCMYVLSIGSLLQLASIWREAYPVGRDRRPPHVLRMRHLTLHFGPGGNLVCAVRPSWGRKKASFVFLFLFLISPSLFIVSRS
jgi:hypothetical protein